MKKSSNNRNKKARVADDKLTIGFDVGDASTNYCVLNSVGEIVVEGKFTTTRTGVAKFAAGLAPCRMALEVGIHSPWMSRQLAAIGHEVIVAHARNVRMISESSRKDDRLDARMLARLARIDPQLLSPVRHRTTNAQAHMNVIRARAVLVQSRTAIINAIRGLCKSFGEPLKKCGAESVRPALGENLTPDLKLALMPLLEQVEALSKSIKAYEQQIENIAKEFYPETAVLKQVYGVGTLVALTYVLTIEDAERFRHSRDVGCYLGLRPGRRNSGQSQPQMHISKEGNTYLRFLLVQSAHHLLGRFGTDCDLRRWGLKLAERGGKNAKRRAVVAVARKLAVLLHRLWASGQDYQPFRQATPEVAALAA